jgi:hypothetical protein
MISENVTVEGIDRVFIDAKHPGSLNRFLTAGIWRRNDLNKDRISLLKPKGVLG